ncbi:cell division protein FtsA [Parabacteroides sp. PF5-9]|uniref:cell division protein FtsA n=1 Tax=Parabacteroides sp. PF5-9 TaxID=1742404 RepID=UPI00247563EF|nr:cell division protein FtsA [Parabacteroides sp. PF5-9]MDH6359202.1 cell division protein FtsA [Parabacteroides sp. PF5-9]
MAITDFIAAVDLGTSHIVGVVGKKNANGTLSILASEKEKSGSCIRRGCVNNIEETASKIKRLKLKLENKLNGAEIGKIYVGIGGQSLHTIDYTASKVLGTDGVVTQAEIELLYQESRNCRLENLDVLAAVSPSFYLDDRLEQHPIGTPANRIEGRYKLIVGRQSLRKYITKSIAEKARVDVAGMIVSPLALADIVLTEDEKDLGCALIGFGAGVTTLTIYKGGKLIDLSVIPLGSHLITRDITNLHIVETEAEQIKLTYGSALFEKNDDTIIQVSSADGIGLREIKQLELNYIVEARTREILENVYARIEETGLVKNLGGGVIITGGGASLKNLVTAVRGRMDMDVRHALIKKELVVDDEEDIANNPQYATVIGLLMKGTVNCAASVTSTPKVPKKEPKETQTEQTTAQEEVKGEAKSPVAQQQLVQKKVEKEPVPVKKKKKPISQLLGDWTRTLFDDEYSSQEEEQRKKEEELKRKAEGNG